jgi:hypothetical protein
LELSRRGCRCGGGRAGHRGGGVPLQTSEKVKYTFSEPGNSCKMGPL